MNTRRFIWFLLPLLLLGCEDETTTPPPPDPLTPDQQTVANCRALRDSFEAYAVANGGSYGEGWLHGIVKSVNPYTGENEPSGPFPAMPGRIALEGYQDCDGTVLGYRITGNGKDGVLITLENIANVPQDVQYIHDVTMANARLVFDAAMRYAAANHGAFPGDVNGTPGADGKTLLDWLPNGKWLINPVTSVQDNPADGSAAWEGGIGYSPIDPVGDGTFSCAVVDAVGCGLGTIVTIAPWSDNEWFVARYGLTLRVAVEGFRQASGHYPHNLDTETTPGGKTVLDLYVDAGGELKNQLTGSDYTPVVGIAANKGEFAYQPLETDGVVTDFLVTARGYFEEILRVGPLTF